MSSWQESRQGVFSRPCGDSERAYLKMVNLTQPFGREDLVIEYLVKFSTADTHDLQHRLKHAWRALRFAHPMIAVELRGDSLFYAVPDQATAIQWTNDTFHIHANEARPAGQVFGDFAAPALVELHYFPRSNELLLRASHWRTDGVGCSILLNHFFDVLGGPSTPEPTWGSEPARLQPALEDVLQLPTEHSSETAAWAQAWIGGFIAAAPSVGLPYDGDNSRVPGRPTRCVATLTAQSTAALVAAAKSQDLTVTAALHAAEILATYQLASPSAQDFKVMDMLVVNLRPHLPAPFNEAQYAGCVAAMPQLSGLDGYSSTTPFLEAAHRLQRKSRDEYDVKMHLASLRPICAGFEQMLSFTPPPDAPLPSHPTISSLGILEQYIKPVHGNVELEQVFSFGSAQMRQPVLCINSWRGRTSLDLIFNDAYYSKELMQGFIQRINGIVEAGLGIMLDFEKSNHS